MQCATALPVHLQPQGGCWGSTCKVACSSEHLLTPTSATLVYMLPLDGGQQRTAPQHQLHHYQRRALHRLHAGEAGKYPEAGH
jgi:hypothetical protein